MAPELPPILMKNSTLALRQAYSQVAKPKAYSKTLFVPQLFVKENVFMLNKLYPTQQKFFTSNDIDIRIQSMVFPKDFTKNETFNRRVAEYYYEIAKHIEQSESNLLKKLGVVKKNLSCAFLVNTLMERNDFALFTSTLKVRRGLTAVFPTKVPPNPGGHRKQLNNLRRDNPNLSQSEPEPFVFTLSVQKEILLCDSREYVLCYEVDCVVVYLRRRCCEWWGCEGGECG